MKKYNVLYWRWNRKKSYQSLSTASSWFLYRPKVIKKVVSQFPFELAYCINSTISRIITLYKWNELTSWPQFLRQKNFKRVFGLKIKGFTEFYNNLWELDLSVKASSVENKLHIIGCIKNKIEKEINDIIGSTIYDQILIESGSNQDLIGSWLHRDPLWNSMFPRSNSI